MDAVIDLEEFSYRLLIVGFFLAHFLDLGLRILQCACEVLDEVSAIKSSLTSRLHLEHIALFNLVSGLEIL